MGQSRRAGIARQDVGEVSVDVQNGNVHQSFGQGWGEKKAVNQFLGCATENEAVLFRFGHLGQSVAQTTFSQLLQTATIDIIIKISHDDEVVLTVSQ